MRLLLVFNPCAASGRAAPLLPRIRARFMAQGCDLEILHTAGPGSAMAQIAARNLSGLDAVVAVGGDGTAFEVLNGLYQGWHGRAAAERPALGLVPVGTGNAFCRDLGLRPGAWDHAVDTICRGSFRHIDVGEVRTGSETFHFLNIIGMGFAVDAGLVARRLKRLGPAAYTLATLWRVLRLDSYPLRVEIDGQTIEQDNVFVAISNSRYTGTHFLMAPAARIDDGWLDVTLLRRLPRGRLLRLFPTIYSGRHLEYPEVTSLRARIIRLVAPADSLLAPDGEFRGRTPAEVRCLHRDLKVYAATAEATG